MDTLQWASAEHGDSAVRVRPSAPATHCFLPSSPFSLEKSSGLPLSAAKIAVPVRGQREKPHRDARRNRRAGAPKRANHALPSSPFFPTFSLFWLFPTCFFPIFPIITVGKRPVARISCFSWFIPSSLYARRNCRAGAPMRASHALLSTLFSLLPTLDAHCKVTTHYFLPSPPYSLL